MSNQIRTRFAPSPTGDPHLGNIRSAIFDYLFARHNKGQFLLRLEDTDKERAIPGSIEVIKDSLRWLGMQWDEGLEVGGDHGPYIQSERLPVYRKHAEDLLGHGLAYKDYTSSEKLDELRKAAQLAKKPFKFTKPMAKTKPDSPKDPFVIRFQIQPGSDVVWKDAVWGEQRWQREVLDDFIAIKSDGYPTYNFANVIDDHLMNISHVLRGSEFISSTPKFLLVYEAFGWKPPVFAHLPLVLGPDKSKLSKRHGAKSILEYRDEGYLPEAVFNYLASLGFNDGSTKEIYSVQELTDVFDLDRIGDSPAVFDAARLDWMNGLYIRNLSLAQLYQRSKDFWPHEAREYDDKYKQNVLQLVQERLKYLGELGELTIFFFSDPTFEPSVIKVDSAEAHDLLNKITDKLEKSDFSHADLEEKLRKIAEDENVKTGQLFGLIRIAITGKTAAPGLFETLSLLGKEPSLRRLEAAKTTLSKL